MYKIFLTVALLLAVFTTTQSKAQQVSFIEQEQHCLATAIYREARGETIKGQVLVAETVINRTKDGKYPSTICKVVKQKGKNVKGKIVCQFSWNCMALPKIEPDIYQSSFLLAGYIINRKVKDISNGALFFFKDDELKYVRSMGIKLVAREGTHGFYRLKQKS